MEPSGFLFYDMTSIVSYSRNLNLAEKGYNPEHEYDNQVTVIIAFSVNSWIPVAVDVFYGSVKDIRSLGYFIERFHDDNMGFIVDHGMLSKSIIRGFIKMKMHYIVAVRRNSTPVPYRLKLDPAFMYNDRPIQSTRKSSKYGYIYILQALMMRAEEESTVLRDVAYSIKDMEYFEDENESLGVFVII